MCNSEQQFIEQNICELLQQVRNCCTSKEELDNIKLQIDSVQLWINSFEEGIPKTNNILLFSSIGEVDANSTLQDVLEYLYNLVDNIQLEGSVNLSISNRNSNTLDIIPSSGNGTTIPSATTTLSGLLSSTDKVKLDSIQSGAEQNVQSDWDVTDNTSDAFIKNKPTIPSISGLATENYVNTGLSGKQDVLVSGANIKTINGSSLLGSGNLTITTGSGEINTASNVGTSGEGIFKQKAGVNLEFKKLNPASNKITIVDDISNNKLDVDVVVANLTGIAQSQVTGLTTDLLNKQDVLVSGINIKTINSIPLLGSGNINIDLSVKQTNIQFQKEGVNLGTSGTVDKINFTGVNVTASLSGNTLTVDVTGGSGTGATNLDYTSSALQGIVTSDTGTDAIIPLASNTIAGLLSPSQFTKLSNISITQAVDLDQLESDVAANNAKITNATHTGDVSGSTVLTLATVNSNVGTFGSGTQIPQLTVNGKGLVTGVSNVSITPTASSITGAGDITKVDDSNVTLTLGGTPIGSVLNNVSFTLGWNGTLADNRIASSSNWNTAYSNRITSLTTTGSSGSATLISNVLNIPTYTLSGLGGQPLSTNLTSLSSLSYVSNSFVKLSAAGTFSLDTNSYYLASNPNGYTSNVGTVISVAALTIGSSGTDVTSTVATSTTTPVITLNIPSASASNRGVLTSTDWSTFNSKQAALSGTGLVKSTGGTISYLTDNSTGWDKAYQQNKIRIVSVNTTLSATTDGTVVFDTASTTATLPSSVNETILVVKNVSVGTITVSGHIDGLASSNYVLQARESMKFHGNGTTWYYIG